MSHIDVDIVDQLIVHVHKRPQLWDRYNRYHSNRHAVDKCWREIADEMKVDENKLRRKWKYLRDQFSVEYGKIPPGSDDELAGYEPKWRYYKQLQFLEEVVTPRTTCKNPKRDEESSEDSPSAPDSPLEVEYKKRRRPSEAPPEQIKRKQRDRAGDIEEHMYFFRSLLPHVRCIPAQLQLAFRSKVQEVVEEFAYGERSAPFYVTCASDTTKPHLDQDDQL